jgi:hypothetical protein
LSSRAPSSSIQCNTDHGIALYQFTDLHVTELAVVGHEGPAIIVAGPDRAMEKVKGILKLSHSDGLHPDKAKSFHFFQQFGL